MLLIACNISRNCSSEVLTQHRQRMYFKFCSQFVNNINRKKLLKKEQLNTELHRCLSVFDLILMGLSAMLGSGLYVLTGTVARWTSGPGVILSYLGAAVAAFLSALCYAEFGSRIPTTGSSYIFTYLTMGEVWGFLMGWNMVLEHGIGSSSVAKAWSGYLDSALGYPIRTYLNETLPLGNSQPFGEYLDVAAASIVLLLCLCVASGAKCSTRFNMFFTFINISVVLFIIVTGLCLANVENWTHVQGGFLPFGFSGVVAGASRCFYAYAGFDVIASSCEEARNPKRDVPIALAISLLLSTLSYVGVSAVLTLMVPWYEVVPKSAIPDAYGRFSGWKWAQVLVTIGSLCTMTTSMFSGLFVMPRILYAISKDGLLCPVLANVNEKTQVPLVSVLFTAILCSIVALIFDLETLVQFMSIGTLTAYSFVAVCVILLRYSIVGDIVTLTDQPLDDAILSKNEEGERPSDNFSDVQAIATTNKNQCSKNWTGDREVNSHNATETSMLVSNAIENTNDVNATMTSNDDVQQSCRLHPVYDKTIMERLLKSKSPQTMVKLALGGSIVFGSGAMLIIIDAHEQLAQGSWEVITLLICLVMLTTLSVFILQAHEQRRVFDDKSFKVPCVPYIPLLCVWTNIFFMFKLEFMTWIRLVIWLAVGLVIYFTYGYHHSILNPHRNNELWDKQLRNKMATLFGKWRSKKNDQEVLISNDVLFEN